MSRVTLTCLLLFITLLSCTEKHSAVLTISEMKPIIWDMLNADNWNFQTAVTDTANKNKKNNLAFYDKIFKQYDITKEQFYKSYKYYEFHPDRMKILIDSVEAYGQRQKSDLDKPKTPLTTIKKNLNSK